MKSSVSLIILFVVVLVVGFASMYTVQQYQQAVILRLGKFEMQDGKTFVATPGLHWKIPFIETVEPFDMRIRTLQADSNSVMTEQQKQVAVDSFIKWRIKDIVKYYKSTASNSQRASQLLQQNLQDAVRNQFGKLTITELVDTQRAQVMENLKQALAAPAAQLGIQVIDVRIKKIELPDKVQGSIFARMRSKRENNAAAYRAEGRQAEEKIKADADANKTVILATAKSNAAKIRAEGAAKAAKIYSDAYKGDPNFYAFYRSLEAYTSVFNGKDATLVLSPNSQFFQYFNTAAMK